MLDLNNGYLRKDAASASNVYYGYNINPNAADSDLTWAIRKVSTTGGVENVVWANSSATAMYSSWTNRAACFVAPTASLGLTYSVDNGNATIGWNLLTGVEKYIVTVANSAGRILSTTGHVILNVWTPPSYTNFVVNQNKHGQVLPGNGTYSVTLSGVNQAGSTSSTISIYVS